MTPTSTSAPPVPPWLLAVVAMFSVQLGSALSMPLMAQVGPAGAAWLRLSVGALIFLAVARPSLRSVPRADIPPLIGLGVATGLLATFFLAAITRIPLGTAVAIEFLGPLGVAALRAHTRAALLWPALALVGVLLLTEPWSGSVDLVGIGLAAAAALGWAAYIVLTQHIGDRFAGLQGLSITIPVAAVTAAFIGVPQAFGNITWQVVAAAFGLALLLPVIPFSLEMLALRRLTTAAFGTLMALEPAFGLLMGVLLLAQIPDVGQVLGVALVVAAGVGAERSGHREPEPVVPLVE